MPALHRRNLLQIGCSVGLASVAGCLGSLTTERTTQAERRVSAGERPTPGTWPASGYDDRNAGHNPHATPPRSEPSEQWHVPTDGQVDAVVVGPDAVYAGTDDEVLAVAFDGTERWRAPVAGRLRYVAGRLYAFDRDVVALDAATGESVWTAGLDEYHIGSVVEANGTVHVAGTESIHGLHADTGAVEWRVETPRHPQLVADEGAVFAVTPESVRRFDPGLRQDGLFADPTPAVIRREPTNWRRLVMPPSLVDGSLYVGQYADHVDETGAAVRRFEIRRGDEYWMAAFEWRGVGALAVADGTVFATPFRASTTPPEGSLVALDAVTGRERWRYDGPMLGRPAVADGLVVAGAADPGSPTTCVSSDDGPKECHGGESPAESGVLLGFDADSGEVRWTVRPGAQSGGYPVALAGDRVYFGDASGLYALE